jgi:small subunit ribosomal protein S15
MHLNSDEKVQIFEKYGKGKTDTGSPEAQIALFSVRIAHLTEHLKSNHKDYTTARALKALVGKRRRLLDYLIKKSLVSASKLRLLKDYTHKRHSRFGSAVLVFIVKCFEMCPLYCNFVHGTQIQV